jgi:hypothetical protein
VELLKSVPVRQKDPFFRRAQAFRTVVLKLEDQALEIVSAPAAWRFRWEQRHV